MSFALKILDKLNRHGGSEYAAWQAMGAAEIGELLNMARAETRNPPGLQKNFQADACFFMTLAHSVSGGDSFPVPVVVESIDGVIAIGFGGFSDHSAGDANGLGRPVGLEIHEGELRVFIWGDINQEEYTHDVSLAGAAERQRKDDGDTANLVEGVDGNSGADEDG